MQFVSFPEPDVKHPSTLQEIVENDWCLYSQGFLDTNHEGTKARVEKGVNRERLA